MNTKNKLIYIYIIFTIATACVPTPGGGGTPTYNCTDSILIHSTKNNLVAYFCNFDLTYSGIIDNNGKPIRGIVYGNVQTTTNSLGDTTALYFNGGAGDYISVVPTNFPTFNDSTPISIILWYKTRLNGNMGDYELLFGRDTGLHQPNTYGQFSLGLYDVQTAVFGYNKNSLWDATWRTESSTNKAKWQNIIAIYNPAFSNGYRWKLYRNGVLTTQSYYDNLGPAIQQQGNYYIGKGFTGEIDDIKIYNIAIDSVDIPFFSRYITPKKCN